MRMMMAIFRIGCCVVLAGVVGGCGSPSPTVARAVGVQLRANYDAEIRDLALRGIAAQEADGDIGPGTADVLRRTVAKHGELIDALANPK